MKKYIRNITEAKACCLFDEKFGTDIVTRADKVNEEHSEFQQALQAYKENPTAENLQHLKDEMSDLYATVTHTASVIELYQNELLDMAIDKVKGREIDNNYKRYKPQQ